MKDLYIMDRRLLSQISSAIRSTARDQKVYEAEGTAELLDLNTNRKKWGSKRVKLESGIGEIVVWEELDVENAPLKKLDEAEVRKNAVIDSLKKRHEANQVSEARNEQKDKPPSSPVRGPKSELIDKIKSEMSHLSLVLNPEIISKGDAVLSEDEIKGTQSFGSLRSLVSTLTKHDKIPSDTNAIPRSDAQHSDDLKKINKLMALSGRVSLLEEVIGIADMDYNTLENNALAADPDPNIPLNIQRALLRLTEKVNKLSKSECSSVRGGSSGETEEESENKGCTKTATMLKRLDNIERVLPRVIMRLRGLRILDSEVSSYSNLISSVSQRQADINIKLLKLRELLDTALASQKSSMEVSAENVNILINRIEALSKMCNIDVNTVEKLDQVS